MKNTDILGWLASAPNDARLELRLPQQLLDAVTAFADLRGWSVSFAVKYLLASRTNVSIDSVKRPPRRG